MLKWGRDLLHRLRGLPTRAARIRQEQAASAARNNAQTVAIERLRERITRSGEKLSTLRRELQELRDGQAQLAAESSSWRRQVLSAAVLRQVFPLRASLRRAASTSEAARSRETTFLASSPSYRQASSSPAAPDEHLRCIPLHGLSWWIPVVQPHKLEASARFVAKQGLPFRAILQTRELSAGGIMLDLGANIGRMSIPRVILGDVELAYCAEPDPLNYAALVGNVISNELRGLVLPDQLAIGDKNGVARLKRGNYSGSHRLVDVPAGGEDDIVEVPCSTLDRWVETHRIDLDRVSFIKVDTQGWEGHVLAGAAGVLARRHISWQIEIAPWLLAGSRPGLDDLLGMIGEHFTHFINLDRGSRGPRLRPTSELRESLGPLNPSQEGHSDILCYYSGATR